jgi:Protein of unknown function (DUF3073)
MGRGRAKAKQTRVARELKYHSPNTDLAALQRELAGGSARSGPVDDELDEVVAEDDDDGDDLDTGDDYGNGVQPARRR